ncbi:MAG: hypothetical protein JXR97_02320 [Planctomycetes bacterium]|nr:hypothetical protein [Planctomycetota bacterium]
MRNITTDLIFRLGAGALAFCFCLTPFLSAADGGTGTLKIGSAPIECSVIFRGQQLEKKKAVITESGVPAGHYVVIFRNADKTVKKNVNVREGKITFVFGNLIPPEVLREEAAKAVAKKNETESNTQETSKPKAAESYAPTKESVKEDIAEVSTAEEQPTLGPVTVSRPPEKKEPFNLFNITESKPKSGDVGENIDDADLFFEIAEMLRKAVNPILKADRYKRSERIYIAIIERWPNSDKVELCHYNLARLYESLFYRCPEAAIEKYKDVLEHNFKTTLPCRWRIAVIYESTLKDIPKAKEWYGLTAKYSQSENLREKAQGRIEYLEKKGL